MCSCYFAASTRQKPSQDNDDIHSVDITFNNFTLYDRSNARIVSVKLQILFSQSEEGKLTTSVRTDRGTVDVFHTIDDIGTGSNELLDSRSVPLGESIWRTFDVTDAVQIWQQEDVDSRKEIEVQLNSPELLKSLEITSNRLSELIQNDASLELSQLKNHLRLDVTLVASQTQKSQLRNRRSQVQYHSSGTDCIFGETTCCREQRTVSFADLGWDYWVVSPNHFTLYHCKGSCPQGHRTANNYATIKSQLHVLNPSEWDAPCCTASSLGDLTIQHLTAKGSEEAVMEGIIVEECMCS